MRNLICTMMFMIIAGLPAQSFETVLPDFSADQSGYGFMRTRITDAMLQGPNFDRHYTVITVGCGTQCSIAFIADNKTGQIYDFPYGGEKHSQMYLEYGLHEDIILVSFQSNSMEEAGNSQCVAKQLRFHNGKYTEERSHVIPEDRHLCPTASELFEMK